MVKIVIINPSHTQWFSKIKEEGGSRREKREYKASLVRVFIKISGYELDTLKERKANLDSNDSDFAYKRPMLLPSPSSPLKVTALRIF